MNKKKKRVLLKISGESLGSHTEGSHYSPDSVALLVQEIMKLHKGEETVDDFKSLSCELAIVVGGGNIFRGSVQGKELSMESTPADYAGMLATVINGIVLTAKLTDAGFAVRHMSAIAMDKVSELFIYQRARRHLEKGRIVIFTAGTGESGFTTDSAMVLRGSNIKAELVLKGTKVDGIYDRDPKKHANPRFFETISYGDFLAHELGILDGAAVSTARAQNIPIHVFNLFTPDNLEKIISGEKIGSVIN